jgi:hypothetical protein
MSGNSKITNTISLFKVKSLQKKQRFLAHGNELSRK